MKTAALATTKLLNPVVTSFATILAAVAIQQISMEQKVLWLALGLLLGLVPMVVLYFEYKKGVISSLWSPAAQERRNSYVAWVIISALFSALAFWQEAPRLVIALGLVFLILGLVNLFASTGFKISVHSELTTLFVLTTILSVSVGFIYLVILIPLVGWARVYLKHHNITEVAYGAFLTILAVFFVFSFFGLATF
jgi:hypothetical protein